MAEIAVIGKREEALCYLAAGFTVYEAGDTESARNALRQSALDGCAAVFLTSEYSFIALEDEFSLSEALTPAIIPLPAASGDNKSAEVRDVGTSLLKKYVERAVGADIIFRD